MYSIPLFISHPKPFENASILPLGISVTLPSGVASRCDQLTLRDVEGKSLLFQPTILQRWPDGSIRWCRFEWLHRATCNANAESLTLEVHGEDNESKSDACDPKLNESSVGGQAKDPNCPNEQHLAFRLRLVDGEGFTWHAKPSSGKVVENGPIFQKLQYQLEVDRDSPKACPLVFSCTVKHYPNIGSAIFRLRVRNPQAATHPGGTWDLGSPGSFFIRDLSIEYDVPFPLDSVRYWVQLSPGQELKTAEQSIQLFQASSGGENWASRNHVDQLGQVSLAFRGFELRCDTACERGDRSTPQIGLGNVEHQLSLCMRDYWENFPKCVIATEDRLRLGIFPEESGYLHELQGGEQKTHQWAVSFTHAKGPESLAWYQSPSFVSLSPESYSRAQAVSYLTPRAVDPHQDYLELVDSAIQGIDTFVKKKEAIDQYGWRNYGDLYGDHEAVFGNSSVPWISHYNNQYDCVGGFAIQFLRSGHKEWWDQMIAMADHAWDIDTYHTDRDKNLYNGGLFWHTYHYADADTATHRSYPGNLSRLGRMPGGKDLADLGHTGKRLAKVYAIGGGPSASHNYPTGWMHAYFLSGESDYREAAILAADYVVRIEDGSKTIFRWLSRSDTGLSFESSPNYYGPGRASGNSLHALLTGFELTENRSYLAAAEKLIQRVIHPEDNIEAMDLTNAELRWFYTMFLQALMRYLDIKVERGQNDCAYAYAWKSLVHYGRWMLAHESPTLDHPERLQYPTETWAAQDMRKWHILQYVAWLDPGTREEKDCFRARADFFFDYVCKTLKSQPTHRLCRPTVLMLQFGWQRNWFQSLADQTQHPRPVWEQKFLPRIPFVPQRAQAIRRAKILMVVSAVVAISSSVILAAWLLR